MQGIKLKKLLRWLNHCPRVHFYWMFSHVSFWICHLRTFLRTIWTRDVLHQYDMEFDGYKNGKNWKFEWYFRNIHMNRLFYGINTLPANAHWIRTRCVLVWINCAIFIGFSNIELTIVRFCNFLPLFPCLLCNFSVIFLLISFSNTKKYWNRRKSQFQLNIKLWQQKVMI